jgi:hypothetical protein
MGDVRAVPESSLPFAFYPVRLTFPRSCSGSTVDGAKVTLLGRGGGSFMLKVDQHKIAICALVQPIVESVESFAVNQL